MKLGQMASYLDDGLPEPLRARARRAAAPTPRRCAATSPPRSSSASSARRPSGCSSSGTRCRSPRRASGRCTAPSSSTRHRRRAGRRRQGAVPRRRRGHRERPAQRRPARHDPAPGLRRPRSRRDGRRDQGAPDRGARLPARGGQPAALRRLLPRTTRSSTCPTCCPTLSTGRVLTTELVSGSTWRGAAHLGPARARPRRRVPVPLRVPLPVRDARVQRRPASRQLPVPRRRPDHVPRLRPGQALHRRPRSPRSSAMVRAAAYDHDADGVPPDPRATPGCSAPARRPTDDEVGEYFSQFYESRPHRPARDVDAASTPAASCATRSTAPARSPSTPPCRGRSCSSSGSTSGCTPCSASCGATGNYRRIAEELWPFVAGPPSTPMAVAEQPWLRAVRDPSRPAPTCPAGSLALAPPGATRHEPHGGRSGRA